MKKKILGIVMCMLLVIAVSPVSGNLLNEKNNNYKILPDGNRFYEIDFIIGKIHNISEETINDRIFYNFYAEWIIIINNNNSCIFSTYRFCY